MKHFDINEALNRLFPDAGSYLINREQGTFSVGQPKTASIKGGLLRNTHSCTLFLDTVSETYVVGEIKGLVLYFMLRVEKPPKDMTDLSLLNIEVQGLGFASASSPEGSKLVARARARMKELFAD